MMLKCVIKETISTYSKIIRSLKWLISPIAVIIVGILITVGVIQIFRNVADGLGNITTNLSNLTNSFAQYFITVPLWIWGCIIGLWILIGVVPAHSYIKCHLKELTDEKRKELKTELHHWIIGGTVIGGGIGLTFNVIDVIYNQNITYIQILMNGIGLMVWGWIIGCIFSVIIIPVKFKSENPIKQKTENKPENVSTESKSDL